jgi:hypothetical protein
MSAVWIKSSLPPLLGPLPAWTVLPAPYMLFNFGYVSITLMVISLLTALYLTSKGRTLMWTIRRFRTFLRGYRMVARPLGYRRAMTMNGPMHDFDFEKWRLL